MAISCIIYELFVKTREFLYPTCI